MSGKGRGLTLRELVLFALLGGVCFLGKLVMAGLPNIEPVTLLVMLFTVTFGWRALLPVYTYVLLELVVYPPELWSISYLYIWLVPVLLAMALRRCETPLAWALAAGGFGLLFGALCAPVYLATGGWAFAAGWWVSGIPFDLVHGAGNFALTLALFRPLRVLLGRLYAGMMSK